MPNSANPAGEPAAPGAASSLAALDTVLADARAGRIDIPALAARFRSATAASALPPRYGEVLERILSQLESSALFSEESCSFSQTDLYDALADWLAKAQAYTAKS
ncbi:MAG: hypothetical protein HZB72_13920 [Burkholderiales bacterium]|nr:hypothetical protein [Burkholderiales bacterium]